MKTVATFTVHTLLFVVSARLKTWHPMINPNKITTIAVTCDKINVDTCSQWIKVRYHECTSLQSLIVFRGFGSQGLVNLEPACNPPG